MGDNHNINREIAILLIAIDKINKEIQLLKQELSNLETRVEEALNTDIFKSA